MTNVSNFCYNFYKFFFLCIHFPNMYMNFFNYLIQHFQSATVNITQSLIHGQYVARYDRCCDVVVARDSFNKFTLLVRRYFYNCFRCLHFCYSKAVQMKKLSVRERGRLADVLSSQHLKYSALMFINHSYQKLACSLTKSLVYFNKKCCQFSALVVKVKITKWYISLFLFE